MWNIKLKSHDHKKLKKILPSLLPVLVIVIAVTSFIFPTLKGIHLVGLNDWDLIFSYYHPMREAFLAHQFPWWNPYNSGGTPLFGNPQIGVFSLQTPFILIYGVVAGLKYAAVLYYVIGALGMYALIRRLGSPQVRSILLSLVWTFSSFTAFHYHVGHYTFLTYLLVPWIFYLFIRVGDSFWFFPALGLSLALFINTAVHNIVIQSLLFLTIASPFIWWTAGHKLKTLGVYALALLIAVPLALPKLLLSFQFVAQSSREIEEKVQLPIPWAAAWRALTSSRQVVSDTSLVQNVGWWEVSAFIGASTITIAVIGAVISASQRRFLAPILCLLAALMFAIALGGGLYQGLLHVPGFDLMRVPSRWLAWSILAVVLAVGAFRHKWRYLEIAICLALLTTVVQEYIFIRPQFNTIFTSPAPVVQKSQLFEQYEHYPVAEGRYTSMYDAELAGYGEVRGYEAVLGYNWDARPTARCGINSNCHLLSVNAELIYWTPNVMKLKRLSPGPITVNINPTNYLWVNGKQAYPKGKVVELLETVVITDPASLITLEMKPSLLFK